MKTRYNLGPWQCQALRKITSQGNSAREIVGDISSVARRWRNRYYLRLRNAVVAHNNGRAKNSPLPEDVIIQIGHYGECGELGYKIVHMQTFPGILGDDGTDHSTGAPFCYRPGLRNQINRLRQMKAQLQLPTLSNSTASTMPTNKV